MSKFTKYHSDSFYRRLAAIAIGGPMLLVLAVSQLPAGLEQGDLIVDGLGAILAVIATALGLRTAYAVGFSKALRIAASAPGESVTA